MRVIAYVALLIGTGFLAYQAGIIGGQARAMMATAPVEAKIVYDAASLANYEQLRSSGVARNELISDLRQLQDKFGPVISYELKRVVTTGAKRFVTMTVKRTRGTYQEELFGIGASGFEQCRSQPLTDN